MPLDRTVCPDCRNRPGGREGCKTCSGDGTVCPVCRGARWVVPTRQAAGKPLKPCGCTIPVVENGKERWRPDPHREVEMILRYRMARQRDEDQILALEP